mgnify:CR=1 FL=1|jgi:low temperature requirement protein LtrA
MFELFFDLVFVYAISRITAMIHHPVNGGIPLATFLEFLLVVVVVMEIWLYQVVYFNRYSKNNFLDIAGIVLNMFTAVCLANNINTEWRITFHYFNIAMAVMIATIFCQYLFTSVNEVNDKREFLFILGIEFFLVILGLILGYSVGIYFCIAAYIIGLILPIFLWEKFKAERVNFLHLVERVSLIVIIAFGEVIVNLANYFNSKTPLMYAAFFLSLVLMFASYVLLSDKIINHHQISRGFVLMYSHIAIAISVLLMTVDALYLNNKNVDRKFLYGLIVVTIVLYYFSLIVNQVYNKKVCRFEKIEAIILLTIFVIGALILWLVKNSILGVMICLLIWNLAFFLVFLMKSKNSLN